jgi:hypothetical protein
MDGMRSPIRTLPLPVERWAARLRYLRWLDGLVAWFALWLIVRRALPRVPADAAGVGAIVIVVLVALAPPIRRGWRPVSAAVGLALSRKLRPGDRAWYITPGRAEPVIVTARRGVRLTIARPDLGVAEGLEVRRTRVLLVPLPC